MSDSSYASLFAQYISYNMTEKNRTYTKEEIKEEAEIFLGQDILFHDDIFSVSIQFKDGSFCYVKYGGNNA